MQRYSRRKRRPAVSLPEITLTPLIDTALCLLVIFMVTTPMMNNAIKVELPKSQSNEDNGAKQELVVFVDQHEKLFLNGESVKSFDDLIKRLQSAVGADAHRTVFVKADKTVAYGNVIELVDHIKIVGGISYVALATKRA